MRKSKLKNGTPFMVVKVEHFVTAARFATALADHCWTKSKDFNPGMKRLEAMEILKLGLVNDGKNGVLKDGQFEGASEEAAEAWEKPYREAQKWVLKNYPYLK